jgi:hypothetical protein
MKALFFILLAFFSLNTYSQQTTENLSCKLFPHRQMKYFYKHGYRTAMN